jgi:hypothetical protein
MEDILHWTCPFCGRDTTIREGDFTVGSVSQIHKSSDGLLSLKVGFIVCPNPECKKTSLNVELFPLSLINSNGYLQKIIGNTSVKKWDLIPSSKAKKFPKYIPTGIIDDYEEACLILNNSPKASATLARRCLQGIIRNFWKVKPGKLFDEIEQIKAKVDIDTWEAIDSVRSIGNIGAHMEKDINLIIDVDPNEAELLLNLIETLIKDWYINSAERKNRLQQIKSIASAKSKEKKKGVD